MSEFQLLSKQIRSEVGSLLQGQGFGQALTVTRPATSQGGAATTSTVYFSVQPLESLQSPALLLEATYNAGDGNAQNFVCAGDSDVAENDVITYDGFTWRVRSVNGSPMGGIAPVLHCFAERERAT